MLKKDSPAQLLRPIAAATTVKVFGRQACAGVIADSGTEDESSYSGWRSKKVLSIGSKAKKMFSTH